MMSTVDVRLKCEKPGDILYTMTITMSAEHWEKLRDQLSGNPSWQWPASDITRKVDDLLGQARKVYWPSAEIEP